eukprot:1187772-Prorocentrum_minimum.AAC.1
MTPNQKRLEECMLDINKCDRGALTLSYSQTLTPDLNPCPGGMLNRVGAELQIVLVGWWVVGGGCWVVGVGWWVLGGGCW